MATFFKSLLCPEQKQPEPNYFDMASANGTIPNPKLKKTSELASSVYNSNGMAERATIHQKNKKPQDKAIQARVYNRVSTDDPFYDPKSPGNLETTTERNVKKFLEQIDNPTDPVERLVQERIKAGIFVDQFANEHAFLRTQFPPTPQGKEVVFEWDSPSSTDDEANEGKIVVVIVDGKEKAAETQTESQLKTSTQAFSGNGGMNPPQQRVAFTNEARSIYRSGPGLRQPDPSNPFVHVQHRLQQEVQATRFESPVAMPPFQTAQAASSESHNPKSLLGNNARPAVPPVSVMQDIEILSDSSDDDEPNAANPEAAVTENPSLEALQSPRPFLLPTLQQSHVEAPPFMFIDHTQNASEEEREIRDFANLESAFLRRVQEEERQRQEAEIAKERAAREELLFKQRESLENDSLVNRSEIHKAEELARLEMHSRLFEDMRSSFSTKTKEEFDLSMTDLLRRKKEEEDGIRYLEARRTVEAEEAKKRQQELDKIASEATSRSAAHTPLPSQEAPVPVPPANVAPAPNLVNRVIDSAYAVFYGFSMFRNGFSFA